MKRKHYPWIGIVAFLLLVLLGPLLVFPKLQMKLGQEVQRLESYQALPAKSLDWHGRNAYLSVPEGLDTTLVDKAVKDMEAVRGIRAVDWSYGTVFDQVWEEAEPVAESTTQISEEVSSVPKTENSTEAEETTEAPTTETPSTQSKEEVLKEAQEAINQTLSLNAIEFDYGTAALTEASKNSVKEMADLLEAYPDIHVLVTGYTDAVGTKKNNQIMSLERAQAVVDELINNGIETARLSAEGKGEDLPIASNDTEEGRKVNRRVELTGLEN